MFSVIHLIAKTVSVMHKHLGILCVFIGYAPVLLVFTEMTEDYLSQPRSEWPIKRKPLW